MRGAGSRRRPKRLPRRRPMNTESRANAWLEARIADIAERLQGSLAGINPDKAVAHLNHRLDAIEERFNEALSQVAQRSDLDGLKLIEAHVMELAAHVEQTRGRLDRIDAIDEQMQGLARRLEDGDHRRLDALEKLLQDYVAEWRKGDERTASALRSLEDVVNRVGESIETMEAQKPVPDLSLSLLGRPHLGELRDRKRSAVAGLRRCGPRSGAGSTRARRWMRPTTCQGWSLLQRPRRPSPRPWPAPAADPRKTDPPGDPLPRRRSGPSPCAPKCARPSCWARKASPARSSRSACLTRPPKPMQQHVRRPAAHGRACCSLAASPCSLRSATCSSTSS